MKTKFTFEMTIQQFKQLSEYLIRHEKDIALDINDYGDLIGLYISIFECDPTRKTKNLTGDV